MQPNTNIILSIGSGPCTIVQGQDTPDGHAHDRSYSAPVVTTNTDGISFRQPAVLGSLQPVLTSEKSVPADRLKPGDRTSSWSKGQSQGHTKSQASSNSVLDLRVDVTNIWFGLIRCKPQQPVLLTEQGITMHLKMEDKGGLNHVRQYLPSQNGGQ